MILTAKSTASAVVKIHTSFRIQNIYVLVSLCYIYVVV